MLTMQVSDWRAGDEDIPKPDDDAPREERAAWFAGPRKEFVIDAFGVAEDHRTVSARIKGFRPYFFIELPCLEPLPKEVFELFIDDCIQSLVTYGEAEFLSEECEQVSYLRFGGYQWGKPRWFAKLVFHSDRVRKQLARTLRMRAVTVGTELLHYGFQRRHRFELYENNIEPMLRFFHEAELNPSGWIQLPLAACTNSYPKLKRTAIDVQCDWNDPEWKPGPDGVVRAAPAPGGGGIGPITLCSFDIEADSSHGDFPLAIKDYAKLANDIVDVFILRHLGEKSRPLSRTTVRNWLRTAFAMDGARSEGISRVYTKRGASPPEALFSTEVPLTKLESATLVAECKQVLCENAHDASG